MVATDEITLTLRRPHKGQAEVIEHAARFNVVACGRRWGKTTLGEDRGTRALLRGRRVGWFGPTYKNLSEVWERYVDLLAPITRDKSEQDKRIETLTRGVLECWSLDTPDPVRGRPYDLVLVDEAAHIARLEYAWTMVIRPTLTDTRGAAWFTSTPNGHNYFHTLYQRGNDPEQTDWRSWQMPTANNPYISQEEIEQARRDIPDRSFAQEYLAQFLEDGGGVLRNVARVSTGERQPKALPGHEYAFGIDWGRSDDFTVISVWDLTAKRQVWLDRFSQTEYAVQVSRFEALFSRYRPIVVIAEYNSIGGPLVELLQRKGYPVYAWVATNATKAAVIDAYALGFEQESFVLLDDPVQIAEHQAYTSKRLPSGLLRYAAPEGQHDDTVIANALAWQAARAPRTGPARLQFGGGGGARHGE